MIIFPRSFVLKFLVAVIICSTFFVSPVRAQTMSQEEMLQRLNELVAIVAQLQAQLALLQEKEGVTGQLDSCPYFTQTLSLGSADRATNGEVSRLQRFLEDSGYYNYGEITGYFGPVTQTAVQAWQSDNGVASYGTPSTTGFGVVGPITRQAISRACKSVATESGTSATDSTVKDDSGSFGSGSGGRETDQSSSKTEDVDGNSANKNTASSANETNSADTTSQKNQSVSSPTDISYSYSLSNFGGGNEPVFVRSTVPGGGRTYNYDPSIIKDDDGLYRMYWCGGVAGDHILYAESDHPSGPWSAFDQTEPNTFNSVFKPHPNENRFDSLHTCDPTIAKFNNSYFLYYTGSDGVANPTKSAIGGGQSNTGRAWLRANSGDPIVVPTNNDLTRTDYGAGQQTIAYADGYYYFMYTDTTGEASLANGAGQYVIRSKGPYFQSGVEVLTEDGFAPMTEDNRDDYIFYNGFNVDLAYIPDWEMFLILSHREQNNVHVILWDKDFSLIEDMIIPNTEWRDGPGLVTNADRTLTVTNDKIRIDMLRAVGERTDPFTWNLAWRSAELTRATN